MSFRTSLLFVYVSSFKPERKQASIHAQISAYITLCVFVYVSVCPALWMEPLSCHLLLSCSWGGASESKQTANWGCQSRIAETTPGPGSHIRTRLHTAPCLLSLYLLHHLSLFFLSVALIHPSTVMHPHLLPSTWKQMHKHTHANTHPSYLHAPSCSLFIILPRRNVCQLQTLPVNEENWLHQLFY